MTTVKLEWWNGSGHVERELTVSHDCPKCLTIEAVLMCQGSWRRDECSSCGAVKGYNPVRCSLCETEYARPWRPARLRDPVDLDNSIERTVQACDEARARFERESEAEAERISKLPLDEQRRIWLETLAAYSPQPERMRSFFGLKPGELAAHVLDVDVHAGRITLANPADAEHFDVGMPLRLSTRDAERRTLLRRAGDALRGLAAGWRGAL